jgi:probable phosphoglycerate mutase
VIVRIARHGETTWNAVGRYQGRLETPLSSLGQAQAQALAGALRGRVGRIISSPLSRCVQTAVPLSVVTGVPIETDPLLLEIAHGDWEGRYRSEIAQSEPEIYRRWRKHPETIRFEGGESLADVLARWRAFVSGFEAQGPDTLILTHDVVLRVAVLERTGRGIEHYREIRAPNAAYAEFLVEDGAWQLRAACVSDHLGPLVGIGIAL